MFADVAQEIQSFLALPRGWDDQTALPVDRKAVDTALELLGSIAGLCPRRQVQWQDPAVLPDPETGGVDVCFSHTGGAWLMISIWPGETFSTQLTTQQPGRDTQMRRASLSEAAEAVCALLGAESLAEVVG